MARTSAEQWAKRVARLQDSGLTAKEFAAKTGINASTLAYWRWRLSVAERAGNADNGQPARGTSSAASCRKTRTTCAVKAAATTSPEFVEISMAAVTTPPPMLELLLGKDVRVRIPADFDEAALTRVLRAVGAAR